MTVGFEIDRTGRKGATAMKAHMDSRTRHPGPLGVCGIRPGPTPRSRRPAPPSARTSSTRTATASATSSSRATGRDRAAARPARQRLGPQDGSGYGAPAGAGTGTGICDGTGPKGQGKDAAVDRIHDLRAAARFTARTGHETASRDRIFPVRALHACRRTGSGPGCPSHATQSIRL